VVEHLALIADERRVDRHPLHFVLAGHLHLHHAGAGLALDLRGREALLHAAHVLLHELRLLHQLADVAFHLRSSRMVESTTLPSNRLTRSLTKPSECTACAAAARRASRSFASSAAALVPAVSPTLTLMVTFAPKCCSS